MKKLLLASLIALVGCTSANAFPGFGGKKRSLPKDSAYAEYSGCTTTGSTNDQVIKCSTEDANVGGQITHNVSAADGDHWTVATTGVYTSTMTVDHRDNLDTLSGFVNSGSLINDAADLGSQRRTGGEYRVSGANQENTACAMVDEMTATTDKMYWVHTDLAGTINKARFAKLDSSGFARYTGGSSKGSTNNLVTTGYSLAESTNNPVTLNTDATNGDTFTVESDGLYMVSIIGQTTGSLQVSVGAVQNSLNTSDVRASGRPELTGVEVSTCAQWLGYVQAADDIYVLNEDTSITDTDADLHQITIVQLAPALSYNRWDSGVSTGSSNNNIVTGYTFAESHGTAAVLSTNSSLGDSFTVPVAGLYAIGFTIEQSAASKTLLGIGSSVSNSFATSDKVVGDLVQVGGGFIVARVETSEVIWVMSDTDPVDDNDTNQVTIVRLGG